MPSTQSSRADNKIKEIKKRISLLSPKFRRKFDNSGLLGDLVDGLRATSNTARAVWNNKEVTSLLKDVKKLQSASDEAKSLQDTKDVMSGRNAWAEFDSKWATLLRKAKEKK